MEKFNTHFLMSHEEVKEYVTQKLNLFSADAELEIKEVGDGNINYVFIVEEIATKKSVVVKQADVLLRSSGRPLDINRNKIEADILKIQYDLVPEFIPEIYHYDEKMAALTMEDISIYKNLRYELEEKRTFPKLADEISTFLVETLLSTTDLVWDRKDKKTQVKNFVNIDMCDISEDLVFTEPYNDYKKQNVIIEENQSFVETFIYHNEALLAEVATLRNNYMNNAQALVHGDLHSGSIFVNQDGMKVIDPEFAFYGPMGYDIGNVIGNLFFPLAKNEFFDQDATFSGWLMTTIEAIYDQVNEKMVKAYEEKVTLSIYQTDAFKTKFIKDIMADTLGYAGTEIIRRVIGDSKVKEVSNAPLGQERVAMERCLLKLGIDLILHRNEFCSGEELVRAFKLAKA
ncbi:S-methyl-5-thioribose kinase [Vagococcus carniphilus]|uniref:S-methyl-5-thioribose kinase n=1 Tax=Vagococcus carniphilus TaxID=218144 RepID=A0AAW8U4Z5_9ENTE|nr:S-methyl-5-thioribose kinase [Vagococcus carniphilus]MDT2815335.1 S-methyl-5-thioribose kinase [Vagococcus carniphilus]MDT2832884.1 S-methyl-5-thioribose kinase [Vagococcus carniphilus]